MEPDPPDLLMAGPVAVGVLDDAAGQLDVEDHQAGGVGTQPSQLVVVRHRVEATGTARLRRVVAAPERARGPRRDAVRAALGPEERGPEHHLTVLHTETAELPGRDRRRVDVPRKRQARVLAHERAGTRGSGTAGSGTAGRVSGSGAVAGRAGSSGGGMKISRLGSPIAPTAPSLATGLRLRRLLPLCPRSGPA